MKKTAIAILIAVLVVVIGGALLFAGMSALNYKIDKLDQTEYVTNTYDFVDPVREIDIEGHTVDVDILPAAGSTCQVVVFENDWEQYAVTWENGRLIIRPKEGKLGWNIFGLLSKGPRITVTLPREEYALLSVSLNTGDLAVCDLNFQSLNVSLNTGDADISGVQARDVVAHSSTGDVRISAMTPDTADVSVRTGKVELVNVVCSGDLRCESVSGDIKLTDVDGANLHLKASTGSITGTIRTPKTFSASATTGSVRVPDTTGAGRCEAQTSTGSIRLTISGE